MECYACKNVSGETPISPGKIIYEGKYWIVDHAYPTKLLGWLVIVLKRHAEALHDLTKEEFIELAKLQDKFIKLLHEELQSEKEYSVCFAEAEHFKHIHFHIIPKTEEVTEELKGPKVFQLLKVEEENAVPNDNILEFSNKLRSKLI